ncbi:MAG: class I SAM-dependent methyltransferase [Erythrobacter sp.]|nr:MAG: class I SAM-dependent methyltransferase [Erythrobacter sp.]
MTDKSEWQGNVGTTWAEEYRRTDRSFSQLTEQLLALTRHFVFSRVLDVGCGAGELSLAIARGRPDVSVIGVDVSPQLVDVARERASHLANVQFELADAAQWRCDPSVAPDLLVSRHGVMFFDDPPAAFAHLAAQAAPKAGMLFSCFRSPSENPFFSEVVRLLPDPPERGDPLAPGPFAFADGTRVHAILSESGWSQISVTPVDFPMIAGTGADPVGEAVTYFSRIGPAAKAAAQMEPEARERFFKRIRALAERHEHGGIVALPAAAWIVTARKG